MTPLERLPVAQIVRSLADACARWCDPDFPPRVRVAPAIRERTGYGAQAVEYALDALFSSFTAEAILATIGDELGTPDVLDRWVLRDVRGWVRGFPAGRVCIVASRTTIGVALPPAIFALCAKCDVTVKDREDGLMRAFFETLAEERDAFAAAARALPWRGGEHDLTPYDVVVAFGRDATLPEIRSACAPGARFIGFGSKASIGYVAREALESSAEASAIVEGAARDLVLYEGEGCLSLHVLFVERNGAIAPETFASMLHGALDRAHLEFPPPAGRDAAVEARFVQERELARLRAAHGRGAFHADLGGRHLVLLDPPAERPPLFLPRVIDVRTVAAPEDAATYLARHHIVPEAVALAGDRPDLRDAMAACGAARITAFGRLQRPPAGTVHGGLRRIEPFVRWSADER